MVAPTPVAVAVVAAAELVRLIIILTSGKQAARAVPALSSSVTP
jgi:hypothetical protein